MRYYSINGNQLYNVYDIYGNLVSQPYLGGYIEIQPDSWDGSIPSTDAESNTWGFPMSLSAENQVKIKNDVLPGNGKGIMYIRFPLGFAYRGYRNIDEETGLAKNIGERWEGQNNALKAWFSDIAEAGGGLAPEYWCPPVYWLTSGSYNGDNQIWAGGSYTRTTTLASIKNSDPEQYNAQIEAFTDAIVDDFEYLHQNIAPIRMFGLQNEPKYSTQIYGACKYDAQTYNDILDALYQKVKASTILATYNGLQNNILLHVASSDESSPFTGIANTFIQNHSDIIWGYSHHSMRKASGESGSGYGADWYKSTDFNQIKGTKDNVFINEYEYFSTSYGTDEYRCGNNMLRMIYEMVYGGARVLHPIIHICKPTGQNLSSTNTTGYCLYAVNLDNGSYSVNTWAYNSWKMFNDNLPIGAVYEDGGDCGLTGTGYMKLSYDNKIYLFMANNTSESQDLELTFSNSIQFSGKQYSMEELGTQLDVLGGENIIFTIPAYTGQCWIEVDAIN